MTAGVVIRDRHLFHSGASQRRRLLLLQDSVRERRRTMKCPPVRVRRSRTRSRRSVLLGAPIDPPVRRVSSLRPCRRRPLTISDRRVRRSRPLRDASLLHPMASAFKPRLTPDQDWQTVGWHHLTRNRLWGPRASALRRNECWKATFGTDTCRHPSRSFPNTLTSFRASRARRVSSLPLRLHHLRRWLVVVVVVRRRLH